MTTPITRFTGQWVALSNYHILSYPIPLHDYSCISTEHYYQLYRVWNEKDRIAVAKCDTPGRAKRLAHKLDKAVNPLYPVNEHFDPIQEPVMERAIWHKFRPGTVEANILISTGDAHLEEGNYHHDDKWGSCYCPRHISVPGQNLLGKLLMKKRDELTS